MRRNQIYQAQSLWKSLKNPSIVDTRNILHLYWRHRLWSHSKDIYSKGTAASKQTWLIILKALKRFPEEAPRQLFCFGVCYHSTMEQWPEVWRLESTFLSDPLSFELPDQCINALVHVYSLTGRLDKLKLLFDAMERHGLILSQYGWLKYLFVFAGF